MRCSLSQASCARPWKSHLERRSGLRRKVSAVSRKKGAKRDSLPFVKLIRRGNGGFAPATPEFNASGQTGTATGRRVAALRVRTRVSARVASPRDTAPAQRSCPGPALAASSALYWRFARELPTGCATRTALPGRTSLFGALSQGSMGTPVSVAAP